MPIGGETPEGYAKHGLRPWAIDQAHLFHLLKMIGNLFRRIPINGEFLFITSKDKYVTWLRGEIFQFQQQLLDQFRITPQLNPL